MKDPTVSQGCCLPSMSIAFSFLVLSLNRRTTGIMLLAMVYPSGLISILLNQPIHYTFGEQVLLGSRASLALLM